MRLYQGVYVINKFHLAVKIRIHPNKKNNTAVSSPIGFLEKRGLKWYISKIAIEIIKINSVLSFQYTNFGSIVLALELLEWERIKCPIAETMNTILIKIIKI